MWVCWWFFQLLYVWKIILASFKKKKNFARYGILGWKFFFPCVLKMSVHRCLLMLLPVPHLSLSFCFVPLFATWLFPLLSGISLYCWFEQHKYHMPCCRFSHVSYAWGSLEFFICRFLSFITFGTWHLAVFLQIFFLHPSLSPFLLRLRWDKCPWGSVHFFTSFFLAILQINNSNLSLICLFCHLCSAVEPI